jgi:hypothetical protein
MAQESLGFVQLIWDCTHCGTANPGPFRFCSGCGAAMPAGTQFRKAAQDVFIEDMNEIQQAKAGADRYCGFCGGRNPATVDTCQACGGDLDPTHVQPSGQVVGALQTETAPDVTCPACGRDNPATALKCAGCGRTLPGQATIAPAAPSPTAASSKKRSCAPVAVLGLVLVAIFAGIYLLFLRTSDLTGTVSGREWQAQVGILEYVARNAESWRDQLPEDAEVLSCDLQVRRESNEPVEGAERVCGTPYMKDLGNGYAEAVQDCVYLIKDDFCKYKRYAWEEVGVVEGKGTTLPVVWPVPQLAAEQKQGEGRVTYTVFFDAEGQRYTYPVREEGDWALFVPGSQWNLAVNAIGGVVSVDKK